MAMIGVQAMMLHETFASDGVFATLEKVSEIGYHAIEVSALPMTPANVAELSRARSELGMDIASLSAGLTTPPGSSAESLTNDFDKIVDDAKALGSTMIRMGMLPLAAMESPSTAAEFCDRSEETAERLAGHGIGLYYHNHHVDFAKYDGRYLLDILADRSPHVGLEIDVHWVQRGGLDPVATLRRYGSRVAMVHLKDYRIGRLPQSAFRGSAHGDDSGVTRGIKQIVQFAEVGEGNLDWPGIVDTSVAIGARYLLVEQDEHYGRTPLECLQTSYDNLTDLGYQGLFANDDRR